MKGSGPVTRPSHLCRPKATSSTSCYQQPIELAKNVSGCDYRFDCEIEEKKSKRESRKSPQQLEENSQQDNEWQTNHGCYFRTDTTGHFKGRLVHSVRLGSSSSLRHLAKSIGFHSAAVIYYYHSPSVSQIRFSLQTNCTKETHSVLIRS